MYCRSFGQATIVRFKLRGRKFRWSQGTYCYGAIDINEIPSTTMVERIIADIEEGEFQAMSLDEVTTKAEVSFLDPREQVATGSEPKLKRARMNGEALH